MLPLSLGRRINEWLPDTIARSSIASRRAVYSANVISKSHIENDVAGRMRAHLIRRGVQEGAAARAANPTAFAAVITASSLTTI
jgi:hypothetical protein